MQTINHHRLAINTPHLCSIQLDKLFLHLRVFIRNGLTCYIHLEGTLYIASAIASDNENTVDDSDISLHLKSNIR